MVIEFPPSPRSDTPRLHIVLPPQMISLGTYDLSNAFFRRQMRSPSHHKLQRNYESEPRADPERRRGSCFI